MQTYQSGAANMRSRVTHLVPIVYRGSLTNWEATVSALCGTTVYPRGIALNERHWSCEKCRKVAGFGKNRTLQERGEI